MDDRAGEIDFNETRVGEIQVRNKHACGQVQQSCIL